MYVKIGSRENITARINIKIEIYATTIFDNSVVREKIFAEIDEEALPLQRREVLSFENLLSLCLFPLLSVN